MNIILFPLSLQEVEGWRAPWLKVYNLTGNLLQILTPHIPLHTGAKVRRRGWGDLAVHYLTSSLKYLRLFSHSLGSQTFFSFIIPVGVVRWAEWRKKKKDLVKLAYQVRVALSRNVFDKIFKSRGQTQPQADNSMHAFILQQSCMIAPRAMAAATAIFSQDWRKKRKLYGSTHQMAD